MKRLIISRAGYTSLLVLLFLGARAQDTAFKMMPAVTITASSKVPNEVSKSFMSSFQNATKPLWYKMDKDYFVKFITGDQKNHALFAKNGALIYHISYGHEQNLPDEIRDMVKTHYGQYNITMAIFVNQEDRKIWVINLENDKKLVIVRMEDGDLEEVRNLNKS